MPLDVNDLAELARDEGPLRATLCFAPQDRGGSPQKTAIRIANARAALVEALDADGGHPEEGAGLLAAFDRWASGRRGARAPGAVAAFLSPEGARIETPPAVRREGVWIGRGFRLGPVWPDPERRLTAAALIAAEDGARLMRLEDGALSPIDADLPTSLETFLGPKEIEGRAAGRMNQPMRQGDAFGETHRQERDEERARYAGALARGAERALAGSGLPLALVADERMLGLLRETLDYPYLCETAETRHPSSFADEAALAEAVAAVARPALDRRRAEAEARVAQALGRGDPGSDDAETVLTAAGEGRVALLLFDPEPAPLGARDTVATDEPEIYARIDEALRRALATGAEVFATPGAPAPLRALFRY